MSRQERAPLRIIAHNGAPEWGGGEIAVVDLLLGLASRGHHVTLLCNRRLVAEAAQARGSRDAPLEVGGRPRGTRRGSSGSGAPAAAAGRFHRRDVPQALVGGGGRQDGQGPEPRGAPRALDRYAEKFSSIGSC